MPHVHIKLKPKHHQTIAVAILLFLGGFFFMVRGSVADLTSRTIEITPHKAELYSLPYPAHPLTGKSCENHEQRPYAVMFPEDRVARPLSGISKADLVVEMPVIKNGVTRMMALFACEKPEEIGSIRSARHDFIPLAAGFDAIFVHWGGSSFALDDVKSSGIDSINALINPNNVFYRKQGIRAPHNGFTTFQRMQSTAEMLRYPTTTSFAPYPREQESPARGVRNSVKISYPRPYNLEYSYNAEKNSYLRSRGGSPEYDRLDGSQAEAKVVIVMRTTSRQLNADYNDVDITGEGEVLVFQNGKVHEGKWQKSAQRVDSRLRFVDENGKDIGFIAGNIWLHITDYGTEVLWGEDKM